MDKVEARLAELTPRERQVLAKLMEGLINKEIASELGIAEKTVKVHRGRIMEKMGTKSVVQLARMCHDVVSYSRREVSL